MQYREARPTKGGVGPFGFGGGGDSGRVFINSIGAQTSIPRATAAGYSGEIKTIFQTVTAATTVTIGAGGAGGAAITPSAGDAGGTAGITGQKGYAIIFYWW